MLRKSDPLMRAFPKEGHELAIQLCMSWMTHACYCRNPKCRLSECMKMKRVVAHTKICRRPNAQCYVCRQVLLMFVYHAKYCQEKSCEVPYCHPMKAKVNEMFEAKGLTPEPEKSNVWRKYKLRSQIIDKLARTTEVLNTQEVPDDKREDDLSNAKEIERDFFAAAYNRSNYYHLIAGYLVKVTEQLQRDQMQ